MDLEIAKIYGNRVRLRVCGLCWRGTELLLINHKMLSKGNFWAPPGGGVEFGQTSQEGLVREFHEETGLSVKVGKLHFICEFISHPLHAIELFFEVTYHGGELSPGTDPELSPEKQIIEDVRFLPFREIMKLPDHERHGVFNFVSSPEELQKITGYIKI